MGQEPVAPLIAAACQSLTAVVALEEQTLADRRSSQLLDRQILLMATGEYENTLAFALEIALDHSFSVTLTHVKSHNDLEMSGEETLRVETVLEVSLLLGDLLGVPAVVLQALMDVEVGPVGDPVDEV